MTNSQLRTMYMRDHPPINRPALDVHRFTAISSFLHTRMPSSARNLWFRLLHNKVSSKVNLRPILKLPDEMCVFCGGRETTAHMLFTCPSHADAWQNYFALVFVPSGPLNMDQVSQDVMSLNLQGYRLLDSELKVSVFEAVTCLLTSVWRAKWQHYFDAVAPDNQSIVDRAMVNLRHLSALNIL
ncbi:hypothetical protein BD408DRAFT_413543 [Parasitella parasitica]|nr:hypothetical protein BD408DRAFT_426852 [Parasitella parasitica]KAI8640601.1 hypothetical protein BD408DRAFT_419574 [Parasitella parasitica]KAI8644248.1 hypothetical protein BD408DRAFT_413543 [Parasitella parasitica]